MEPKCGWWDQLTGNAIICSETFQNYEVSSEKAGLQAVADNAAKYFGEDSTTAKIAQSTADAQAKYAVSDVAGTNLFVESSSVGKVVGATCNGAPGLDLGFLGGPCITYARLKIIGAIAGAVLVLGVVLYAAGIVSAFVPKRG